MNKNKLFYLTFIAIFFIILDIHTQENEFISHTIVGGELSADGARSVYVIDLDSDGDLDVLSASRWDNKIAWYKNDGNENFSTHNITTDALFAASVYAIDVDNDG
ncbi:MAG: VCBS repeat-containing protein, partial [Candidatus Cloacimonetes bacterium]|nr:VCBS repeat-containing protein [Candidatus Cloacimonadota bacterium]